MRSLVSSYLTTPLVIITMMLLATVGSKALPAYGWELSAECVNEHTIVGTTTVPNPPQTFEVFAEDHVPGQGWQEVQGSRYEYTSYKGQMEFVLDVSGTREGADLYIVGLTSGEKTDPPFPTCPPELTPTATSTVTAQPTSTKTSEPTATETPAPNQPTRTPTQVVPTATSTRVIVTTSTRQVPTSTMAVPITTRTPVIQLPPTGNGGDSSNNSQKVSGWGYLVASLTGLWALAFLGHMLRQMQRRD